MSQISWIQLASQIVENTAWPLDAKMKLSTANRLNLSTTQRWIWMIVYDTDIWKWKTLLNEPWTTSTQESDWNDFISWEWWSITIKIDKFIINWSNTITLTNTPISNSEDVYLTWIHLTKSNDYNITWNDITFYTDCVIDWDAILVKYLV